MNHICLTWMIMQLNHCIDTGKYGGITLEEAHKHAEHGTTFEFLRSRLGSDFDDSYFKHYPGFEKQFSEYLERIGNATTGDSWKIHNNGLCLILAWTNELLAQGKGWKPLKGMIDDSLGE